jgi:hypothetical protein
MTEQSEGARFRAAQRRVGKELAAHRRRERARGVSAQIQERVGSELAAHLAREGRIPATDSLTDREKIRRYMKVLLQLTVVAGLLLAYAALKRCEHEIADKVATNLEHRLGLDYTSAKPLRR